MERRERYLLVAAGIPWLVCLVCAAVLLVVWRARKAAPLPWELSQLGMACLMYAHDHAGSMPPDINSLPASGLLNPKVARDLTPGSLITFCLVMSGPFLPMPSSRSRSRISLDIEAFSEWMEA